MNTMRTRRVVWPLALLATAFFFGCQEQRSSPVEPEGPGILLDKDGIHPHGGGSGGGSGESATVVLGGGYSTLSPQDISFQENGRRIVVRTEDGAQIDYSLAILDITPEFATGSCVWSGLDNDDDNDDAGEAATFWNAFLTAHRDNRSRNLLFRVNKKALNEPAGEHRTEARWWVEDENKNTRVMYLVKVGVPGDLADQLSELPGSDFEPAIGTVNGTTVTITGGAIRLSEHDCGAVTGGTAGCGPQAPTLEVACVNPTSGNDAQVFTATVTIP